MNLDKKERKILAAVQLRADASMPKIAQLTGFQLHTVRYCLQQLEKAGIIRRLVLIDVSRLGLTHYVLYFSLAPELVQLKDRFIEVLKNSEKVMWVRQFVGDYHYGMGICTRTVAELSEFIDELNKNFGVVFHEKSFGIRVSITRFRMRYLDPEGKHPGSITYYGAQPAQSPLPRLDTLDREIIDALTKDYSRNHAAIAAGLRLPTTTFEYRLRKLKAAGVISGFVYQTDVRKIGMHPFLLLVQTNRADAGFAERLFRFCDRHLYVDTLMRCIGNWDYEIAVEVPDPQDVVAVTEDLYQQFPREIYYVQVLNIFKAERLVFSPQSNERNYSNERRPQNREQ